MRWNDGRMTHQSAQELFPHFPTKTACGARMGPDTRGTGGGNEHIPVTPSPGLEGPCASTVAVWTF